MLAEEGIARTRLFTEELRGLLDLALESFELIQKGKVAAGGTTAIVLGRCLLALRGIVNRALARRRMA